MQLMPETADYIARKSGGTRFERADLATPQINIAYGTWYLRYLLDKYEGNTILTLAAYNAGEGKVDEWRARPRRGREFRVASHIPFKETRDYVHRVLSARADYRATTARTRALRARDRVGRRSASVTRSSALEDRGDGLHAVVDADDAAQPGAPTRTLSAGRGNRARSDDRRARALSIDPGHLDVLVVNHAHSSDPAR